MSSDDSMVLTAAYDKSARVWDLASGKCLAVLASSAQVCLSPANVMPGHTSSLHGVPPWTEVGAKLAPKWCVQMAAASEQYF